MTKGPGFYGVMKEAFSSRKWMQNGHVVAALCVAVLGILLYANTLGNSFVLDDRISVENNAFLAAWPNARYFLDPAKHFTFPGAQYSCPVAACSYLLDRYLLQGSAAGYHLANLLVHALNGFLLYLILVFLFWKIYPDHTRNKVALIGVPLAGAMFFVSHPVQSEAVNSISGRYDILMAFFALGSVLFYLRGVGTKEASGSRSFALSLVMYVLSCYCKPSAVLLPILLAFIDIFSRTPGEDRRSLLKRRAPVYILFGAVFSAFVFLRYLNTPTCGETIFAGPKMFFLAANGLLTYVRIILLPFGLRPEYGMAAALQGGVPGLCLATAALLCLGAAAAFLGRKRPMVKIGALWFLLMILPALIAQFRQAGILLREKDLYLPCAGFSAALAFELFRFGREGAGYMGPALSKRIALAAAVILIAIYSTCTVTRNFDWKDGVTFWQAAIKASPGSANPYFNLGIAYQRERNDQDKAIEAFKGSIRLEDIPAAHDALGSVYFEKGLYKEAMAEFEAANAGAPHLGAVYYHLGLMYIATGEYDKAIEIEQKGIANAKVMPPYNAAPPFSGMHEVMGKAYMAKKDYPKAVEEFRVSLKSKPGDPDILLSIAKAYLQNGDLENAALSLADAIRSDPGNIQARDALAGAYLKMKRFDKAVAEYEELLKIDPKHSDSRNNLANLYYSRGLVGKAVSEFKKILEIDPSHFQARNNLANIYLMEGEFERSIEEYRRALKLRPDSAAVHYNLGLAYQGKGMLAEAENEWNEALSIDPAFHQAAQALGTLSIRAKDNRPKQ